MGYKVFEKINDSNENLPFQILYMKSQKYDAKGVQKKMDLSKNDLFSFASRISEMRPEAARKVLSHYPKLADMIRSSLAEYKRVLNVAVKSNDESVTRVYNILDNELNGVSESRKQYYEMTGKIREDASKCLDDPNMTADQKEKILIKKWKFYECLQRMIRKFVNMKKE